MTFAVVFEYDLKKGVCYLAHLNNGDGKVALFGSREEAQAWIDSGEDLDGTVFDTNIIELSGEYVGE
jgi:hypothetical protein